MANRPLGKNQAAVLKVLRERGGWTQKGYGSGWYWNTYSGTARILDSLVQRGLVVVVDGHYTAVAEGEVTNGT
jgi:hypothetical protein